MLSNWRKVNHLLVACGFGRTVAVSQLEPVMQVLEQALPPVHITFLTSEAAGYAVCERKEASRLFPAQESYQYFTSIEIIDQLRNQAFDAAIIFTLPFQSCYTLAYLCYLSGIPIRLGQSLEFGGALLSEVVKPSVDAISAVEHHLHLLESVDLFSKNSLCTSLLSLLPNH